MKCGPIKMLGPNQAMRPIGRQSLCHKGSNNCDVPLPDGVQVDSVGKKLMSVNFMNQELFVKV